MQDSPSRPLPTGLPGTSEYPQTIVRPDRPEIAPGGNRVDPRRIPATLDASAPASRTSPVGQPTAGQR